MPPQCAHRIPCAVEVPAPFEPKARYALRMLLLPLNLAPAWTTPSELPDGGLYYGMRSPAAEALELTYDYDAASYFESGQPYDVAQVQWFEVDSERWPMLFSARRGPDLVASAFFWLSGWQEHTTTARDEHGRFPFDASLQKSLGTRQHPVVDMYRQRLAAQLRRHGIGAQMRDWSGSEWAFCATHDIDYLAKWRPGILYRESVQYFVKNVQRKPLGARTRRLIESLKDAARPGDPYQQAIRRIRTEISARGGTATFFLKAGATSAHDVPYQLNGTFLRSEIGRMLNEGFEVGLHPSYHAHTHSEYFQEERERLDATMARATDIARLAPHESRAGEKEALSDMSGPGALERSLEERRQVVSVRQHYLRYEHPRTPRLQVRYGMHIDSSLGFAETAGFRHGTCLPFQVYDCRRDAPVDLWEMPLAFMESALFNRMHLSLEEAQQEVSALMDTCRQFGGVCVGLWHNMLWDEMDFPGWGEHFTTTLDEARQENAALFSLRDALRKWK